MSESTLKWDGGGDWTRGDTHEGLVERTPGVCTGVEGEV